MPTLTKLDTLAMTIAESILKEAKATGYIEIATSTRLPAGIPYSCRLHRLVASYVSFFAADFPGHRVYVDDHVVRVWVGFC